MPTSYCLAVRPATHRSVAVQLTARRSGQGREGHGPLWLLLTQTGRPRARSHTCFPTYKKSLAKKGSPDTELCFRRAGVTEVRMRSSAAHPDSGFLPAALCRRFSTGLPRFRRGALGWG